MACRPVLTEADDEQQAQAKAAAEAETAGAQLADCDIFYCLLSAVARSTSLRAQKYRALVERMADYWAARARRHALKNFLFRAKSP